MIFTKDKENKEIKLLTALDNEDLEVVTFHIGEDVIFDNQDYVDFGAFYNIADTLDKGKIVGVCEETRQFLVYSYPSNKVRAVNVIELVK